jgi:hypothetical protein
MKKIIVTGVVSAIAAVSFAGTASAAPADRACFGQVHKLVNAGGIGLDNVGQLVQSTDPVTGEKLLGQGKNATAKTFC